MQKLLATIYGPIALALVIALGANYAGYKNNNDAINRNKTAISQAQTAANQARQAARQAAKSRIVLCRNDLRLKEQIKFNRAYLKVHPDGAPALGLSAKVIQDGIDRDVATRKINKILNCGNG